MLRIIAGFALAPTPWLLLAAAERTLSGVNLMFIVVYGNTLLLGVPAYFIFRRMNWLSWWQVGFGAAACATLFGALMLFQKATWGSAAHELGISSVAASLGLINGLWFWLIAIWRNPVAHKLVPTNSHDW